MWVLGGVFVGLCCWGLLVLWCGVLGFVGVVGCGFFWLFYLFCWLVLLGGLLFSGGGGGVFFLGRGRLVCLGVGFGWGLWCFLEKKGGSLFFSGCVGVLFVWGGAWGWYLFGGGVGWGGVLLRCVGVVVTGGLWVFIFVVFGGVFLCVCVLWWL